MSGGQAPCQCSACKGAEEITPVGHANSPGKTAIAYRVGTHGAFKETMLTAVGRQSALARLTTRADDDASIALMDAWAASLDVLAFYQERYANENYLRTATARGSVLQLARMIGYELRPGVAASTTLAYTLDSAPGSPLVVKLAAGAQSMTTPGQDEAAQTFETSEDLEAHAAWNSFLPQRWVTRIPKSGDTFIRLDGASPNLRIGDTVLLIGDERRGDPTSTIYQVRAAVDIKSVAATATDPAYTDIILDRPLDSQTPVVNPSFCVLHQRANLFGAAAADWPSLPATMRNDYMTALGLTPSSTQRDWPYFSILDISQRGVEQPEGTGLYGAYYSDHFNTSLGTATSKLLDFSPSQGRPFPKPVTLASAMRWTGWLVGPDAATHTLQLGVYGHVTVTVDGVLIYDGSAQDTLGRPVTTRAGVPQRIVAEYVPDPAGSLAFKMKVDGTAFDPGPLVASDVPVNLERVVPGIGKNQWAVLANAQATRLYEVMSIADDGLSSFGLMGHSTRVTLRGVELVAFFNYGIRSTTVFAQSEQIAFGQEPIGPLVSGDTITLGGALTEPLPAGRKLIVMGTDPAGTLQSEVVILKSATSTRLTLTKALGRSYRPATTIIFGNCVAATHGATIPRPEPLGAGDGSRRFQSFALKQKPLTYTGAATPSGAASSLNVKVNDIDWTEVPTLYGQPPTAAVFVTRRADDGTVRIQFGNGVTGARLPTGVENVVARYRTGIGEVGMAKAGQINLPLTRPAGLNAVTNPAPPTGAQDPERLDDARRNAPLTVLTLDRVVSVSDYADFARAFAGIGKAKASLVWSGAHRVVHLTIASADGSALAADSQTFQNLLDAIDSFAPAHHLRSVSDYTPRPFKLKAAILPQKGLDFALAAQRVRDTLAVKFSFAARDLGQQVTAAEVIAAIQTVPGIIAARLDSLDFQQMSVPLIYWRPQRLIAAPAQYADATLAPEVLITLGQGGATLTEMAP